MYDFGRLFTGSRLWRAFLGSIVTGKEGKGMGRVTRASSFEAVRRVRRESTAAVSRAESYRRASVAGNSREVGRHSRVRIARVHDGGLRVRV